MERINFTDGQLVTPATVSIDGTDYEVTPEEYTGTTPLSAFTMNKLQDNIEVTQYRLTITQAISGGSEVTLPCNYKVGNDSLKVRYGSDVLVKAIDNDTQGHYYEVGAEGTISNKIQLANDCEFRAGKVVILEVQGVYNNDD